MKDNFSSQSAQYAKYRPGYPAAFFNYLDSLLLVRDAAWDCGTGNGQIASELAKTFKDVFATDISQSQLDNAIQAPNIHYAIQPAEKTDFENDKFDLVTVGQAIHWFDFEKFFAEVNRTAKNNSLLCVIGYGGIIVNDEIDALKKEFYKNVVGPYWDVERKFVDDDYKTIPFPFEEIETPAFENKLKWNLEEYLGYIYTWSAVKKFIRENGHDPVEKLQLKLKAHWKNNEEKEIRFPFFVRLGRILK